MNESINPNVGGKYTFFCVTFNIGGVEQHVDHSTNFHLHELAKAEFVGYKFINLTYKGKGPKGESFFTDFSGKRWVYGNKAKNIVHPLLNKSRIYITVDHYRGILKSAAMVDFADHKMLSTRFEKELNDFLIDEGLVGAVA